LFITGNFWIELEKLIESIIKAKFQRANKIKAPSCSMTLKGERRRYRGPDPRGRPGIPGISRYIKTPFL
jgi:hypothetical protein